MPDYRLYCVDMDGAMRIGGELIEAESDVEALECVRSKNLRVIWELHAGERVVAESPAR